MKPASLEAPLFANLDTRLYFGYFSIAVVHSPLVPSGLPGNNRLWGIETPVEVRIIENFSGTELLCFNQASKGLIYISSRITRFLFSLSEKLLHGHQNIMGRFPMAVISGLQRLPSFVPITIIKDELVKV